MGDSPRLRRRFPAVPIAVVSHGKERFALLTPARAREGVSVQVCGGHAEMNGYAPSSFPPCVEAVPMGPARIARYRARGYPRVPVRKRR